VRIGGGYSMVSSQWFSGRVQREVISYSVDHLNKVLNSAKHLRSMIDYISRGEYDDAKREYDLVRKLEDEADNIKRKVLDALSKSAFHPLDREDLSRLILIADDIADYIKATARKLAILIDAGVRFDKDVLAFFLEISSKLIEALDHLVKSVELITESAEESINYTHKIEEIEEVIDDLRDEALKKILEVCGKEFTGYCMLLKEALDDLEMASDRCEDTGDTIRTIIVSHT
jgi:predicted phosphate transport protein (TIGR00153 family)